MNTVAIKLKYQSTLALSTLYREKKMFHFPKNCNKNSLSELFELFVTYFVKELAVLKCFDSVVYLFTQEHRKQLLDFLIKFQNFSDVRLGLSIEPVL